MAIRGSPILWQGEDSRVTLLDIPRSISAAQGTAERPCQDLLMSTEPLKAPYVAVEPKSERAKQNLQQNTVDENLHKIYRDILSSVLESIRQTHFGPWAHKRPFITNQGTVRHSKKRKLDSQDVPATGDTESEKGEPRSADTPLQDELPVTNNSLQLIHQAHDEPHTPEEICQICAPEDPRFRTNCNPVTLTIHPTKQNGHSAQDTLRLPPYSSCYIGDCAKTSRAFHTAIRHQANEHETRRHFDFILLDPPWPNRSVKRTYQTPGAGYDISGSLDDVYDLLMKMDLDMLMADECLVGVWITNKQAVRELVLGKDGVFDQWGVELVEEWIWLKTTLHGVPVTPIDSAWRKPYEGRGL
ncbi:hypothetical protein PRZ48_014140 [Zasmidium cellare]|uniref:MT-A70-domain-containing protein n=1 Tax=Zasmidium cellare TaxID=395010 RepID=A0ABR0E049_ZASCE|nr:hypothetical protein PRZ48_014140 [Zasmidium cellare]